MITTPIVNYFFNGRVSTTELEKFQRELWDMHQAPRLANKRVVQWLTDKLGKHSSVFWGEFRFKVWERGDWKVYAHNDHGISVEVRENLTTEQMLFAWHDYRLAVGLNGVKIAAT